MTYRAILTFATLTLAGAATYMFAQAPGMSTADKVAWLERSAVPIRTLEPRDADYSDFRAIQQAIGSSRIVLLGDCQGPEVVKAKLRLVRFLHEEMGFDVLATPASLFDAEETERALDRGAAPPFEYYSENAVTLPYLRESHKSGRPLHLAGDGPYVSWAPHEYGKRLLQFVDRIDPHLLLPAERKAVQSVLPLGGPPGTFPRFLMVPVAAQIRAQQALDLQKVVPAALAALARLYDALGRLASDRPDARDVSFYRQTVAILAWAVARRGNQPPTVPPPHPLVLLAGEWKPQSKIVVWADNESIARGFPVKDQPTAGDAIDKAFGTAAYSIAFAQTRTASEVLQVLVAGPQPTLSPSGDNLESLLHAAGKPYSFIDLRGLPEDHWLRQPLTARFINGAETSAWPDNYDAVFSLDLSLVKPGK